MSKTNLYRVKPISGEPIEVEASDEWVAIAKVHRILTKQRVSARDVQWHGTEATCRDRSYCRPVVIWQGGSQ